MAPPLRDPETFDEFLGAVYAQRQAPGQGIVPPQCFVRFAERLQAEPAWMQQAPDKVAATNALDEAIGAGADLVRRCYLSAQQRAVLQAVIDAANALPPLAPPMGKGHAGGKGP